MTDVQGRHERQLSPELQELVRLIAQGEGDGKEKKVQGGEGSSGQAFLSAIAKHTGLQDQATVKGLGNKEEVLAAAVSSSSLPVPEEASVSDEEMTILRGTLQGMGQADLHVLVAQAMAILIKSSSHQSAVNREIRMAEVHNAMEARLAGADNLRSAAKTALITACVTAGVGMAMTGMSIGATVGAAKSQSVGSNLQAQANALKNPDVSTLAGVSTGKNVPLNNAPAAGPGLGSIDAQKASLMADAAKAFDKAERLRTVGQATVGLSGSIGGIGGAAGTTAMTAGQAAHEEASASAMEKQAHAEIAAEFGNRMGQVRDTMLTIMQEVLRAHTQAVGSAFKS